MPKARHKKSVRTTKPAGKRARSSKSGGALENLSVAELQAEITRRQKGLSTLIRKRDRLQAQLAEVNRELAAVGVASRAAGVRPRNSMNLVEALEKVLSKKELSVTEAVEAVQKAGYKTSAANFRVIVNQALLSNKQFKKVSRGVYTLK